MAEGRIISMEKLEAALIASLDAGTDKREECSQQIQRLNAVVGRYRGMELDAEPVAVELVKAVLGWIFGVKDESVIFSTAIVSAVTRSIVEDPAAHQRLSRLWVRLCEETV